MRSNSSNVRKMYSPNFLSIDRYNSHMMSLIKEARVTSVIRGFYLQGAPRNMSVARRMEGRL